MKYLPAIIILLLISMSFFGCSWRNNYFDEYNDFAVRSAKMGLWDEATMRWKRMAELHPDDARIRNNLAVAYEAKGELEMAMNEYKKAIELEPGNSVYQKNYLKFMKRDEKLENKTTEDIIQEDDSENKD